MANQNVVLLDATLRDGGYAIHFQFSARDTQVLCAGLEKAGVQMIEVGHGVGLGASSLQHGVALESDAAYLEAASSALTTSKFGAFFIPEIGSREDLQAAASIGMNFVRIGYEASAIDITRPYTDYAKELGLQVSLNPMKTYSITPIEFSKIAEKANAWGSVDILCVVDSAGCMLPGQVADYTRLARANSDLMLGFHGHNNLGLAHANCLVALAEGANYVDGTLRGMGRSAGNAQTEILAYVLAEAGYEIGVDPVALFNLLTTSLEPLMLQDQGIAPLEALFGMTRFHSSHLPRFRRVLSKYDVDIQRLIVEVSKIDCINPSDELVLSVARDLARRDE